MSLIKIAIVSTPLLTAISSVPSGFAIRAAKSGDPFKYVFSRSGGPIRKFLVQPTSLALGAHMEANMRKGMVQDSTKWTGAILDGSLGQFGRLGGLTLEKIHTDNTLFSKIPKKVLSKIITNEGKYDIEALEAGLNRSNLLYSKLNKLKPIPFTINGTLGGAAIGYAAGDNEHKLKSTLKGGLIGGAIGGTIRGGVDYTHQKFDFIPKVHQEYFKDNYWKKQLIKANSPLYNKTGKLMADALTDYPKNRAKRILASEKWQDRGDKFWNTMNTDVKDLWKKHRS